MRPAADDDDFAASFLYFFSCTFLFLVDRVLCTAAGRFFCSLQKLYFERDYIKQTFV